MTLALREENIGEVSEGEDDEEQDDGGQLGQDEVIALNWPEGIAPHGVEYFQGTTDCAQR